MALALMVAAGAWARAEPEMVIYADAPKELTSEQTVDILAVLKSPATPNDPIERWTTADGKATFLFPRELGGRRYYDLNTKMLDAWLPRLDGAPQVWIRNKELGSPDQGIVAAYAPFGLGGGDRAQFADRWVDPEGYVLLTARTKFVLSDGVKTVELMNQTSPNASLQPPQEVFQYQETPDRTKLLRDLIQKFPASIPLRNLRLLQLRGRAVGSDLAKAYAEFLAWIESDLTERQRQYDASYAKVLARFSAELIQEGTPISGLDERHRHNIQANAQYLRKQYGFRSSDELDAFLERAKVKQTVPYLEMYVPYRQPNGEPRMRGHRLMRFLY